jgi:hypothetical protein
VEALMIKLLYISASPYSGSTLASFLLNTHPEIITVAHTTGWHFEKDEKFYCSCGELIQDCPFYRYIKSEFNRNGLNFEFNDFGTNYSIVRNARLNRYFLSKMPLIKSNSMEKLRDRIISSIPYFEKQLNTQDLANKIFMDSALDYSKTTVFVDNSHNPYRLRQLRRIPELDIYNMHLIRDPRGVALSNKKHKTWGVKLTTKLWLNRQADIVRISQEFPNTIRIFYEELCKDVNKTLESIYNFVGMEMHPFTGNFKTKEHHIIGNDMRLKDGEVRVDTKWRSDLSAKEISDVNNELTKYKERNSDKQMSDVIDYFLTN